MHIRQACRTAPNERIQVALSLGLPQGREGPHVDRKTVSTAGYHNNHKIQLRLICAQANNKITNIDHFL
jgi:hypothetical protein